MECIKLFEEIDGLYEKYCNIWEEVCNIESPTDYKEGVDKVGNLFIDMAQKQGWRVEVLQEKISGNAICITMNPDADGQPVSLSGHIDTVHPIGLFGKPAVHRDETKIYGPGVMDCKGGVVAAFLAMDALKRIGFCARPVHLLIQSDEENSSMTSNKETIDFLCMKAADSVAFLNLEGIQGNTAVLQRKGILRYCFKISGKAIHSSRCAEGANAITEAAYKIIELEKMKDSEGITCNCGVIHGGTVANTVAENCTFQADIRFSTMKELEWVKKQCQIIANESSVAGCTCIMEELSYRPPMEFSEKNATLLERMNSIYEKNQLPVLMPRKNVSGSDAAYVTLCGIPCVDSIGVDGGNIHSQDEYAILASLAECAKRVAAFIYCYSLE